MKIAFLTVGFPPLWNGGTELASEKIVSYLMSKGHEGTVITRNKGESVPKYLSRATNFLKQNNFDIVHCQSTAPAIAAMRAKKPYIVYCRGSDIYTAGFKWKIINKKVLKKAEQVISLTEHMRQYIKKDYGVESIVIPNGVNVEDFYRGEPAYPEQPTVIYVGTLKKVKGVEYLINAMKSLPDWNLWIVGDGPERKALEDFSNKVYVKTTFFGEVSQGKVANLLSHSNYFVLPSLSEGFPNVLLEAMAAGLPIIATKVTGVPEIIQNYKNGLLVESASSEDIVKALKFINDKRDKLDVVVRNNLIKAQYYSWEKIGRRIEQTYENIIRRRQSKQ